MPDTGRDIKRGLLNLSQIFIILSQILSLAVSEFTNPPQEGGHSPRHFRLRLAAAEFLRLLPSIFEPTPQPLDCLIDLFIDCSRHLRPRRQLSTALKLPEITPHLFPKMTCHLSLSGILSVGGTGCPWWKHKAHPHEVYAL
jgi:hypothetical protein